MKTEAKPQPKKEKLGKLALLAAAGLFAGLANGLLRAGGGILVVFSLLRAFPEEISRRDAYATALCVMLPLSALSFFRYTLAGNPAISEFGAYLIPAILGGFAGGILLSRLKNRAL